MTTQRDAGDFGELKSVDYLVQQNYTILEQNWRYKYWEIDIIAKDGDALVFIEVKSRSNSNYGNPADFVDLKKQRNIIKAADAYIEFTAYEGEVRFDIVSVYLDTDKIELIKDAFWSN